MSFSLNNYYGFHKIAEGGMSEIFHAVEHLSRKKVVIKKMALDPANRALYLERYQNEARNASALSHSNIISILDHGEDGSFYYIVMEYVDGFDLQSLMSSSSFNREIGLMIVLKTLQALNFAHKKGVIHCDIKPANILIDRTGRVVLADFGLSQTKTPVMDPVQRHSDFTTPLYMPPEQALLVAEQVRLESDAWAETASVAYNDMSSDQAIALNKRGIPWDLWSVGVLLYRVCCGTFPFKGDDLAGLLNAIVHSEPTKIHKLAADLPRPIAAVIERCLEKEPFRRPISLDPVIDALQKYCLSLGITNIQEIISGYIFDKMGETRAVAGSAMPISPPVGVSSSVGPKRRFALIPVVLVVLALLVVSGTIAYKGYFGKVPDSAGFIMENIEKVKQFAVGKQTVSQVATTSTENQTKANQTVPEPPNIKTEIDSMSALSRPAESTTRKKATKPVRKALLVKNKAPEKKVPEKKVTEKKVTEKAAAIPGILKVTITPPEAQVFFDGSMILHKEMSEGWRGSPGVHEIVAGAPGYNVHKQSILIESNKTQVLEIVLKAVRKGQLHIYSFPWANLYLDSISIGTTPSPKPVTLSEGNHQVLLMRGGFKPYQEVVHIKAGEVTRLQVQLEKSGAGVE